MNIGMPPGMQQDESEKLLGEKLPKKPIIGKETLFGILVVVVFIGGFFTWAALSPLESAALATGKVTVAGSRRTIQHLEGGIVKKINVKDGSKVKKGQVLIVLDNTRAKVSLQLSQNEVFELAAIESRLIAEIYDRNTLTFSDVLTQNKDLPKVQRLMRNQEIIFQTNLKTYSGNVDILKQKIVQLKQQIIGVRAQLRSNTSQLNLIKKELVEVKILSEKRLIERSRVLSLQREEASLEGKRGENISLMSVLQQKIGETQLEVIALTDKRRKELLDELRDVRQKLADASEKAKAARDILERTEIRSPQNGTVVGMQIHTVGGVIKPGDAIMDIVPQDDELIIEAKVSPLDIDIVHKGLRAKIGLSSLPARTAPKLEGKVIDVSADSFQDEQTGESFYKVKVEIGPDEMAKLKGIELYPGMPVEVMIITNKLTPWQYFVAPIRRSFDRAFREQ